MSMNRTVQAGLATDLGLHRNNLFCFSVLSLFEFQNNLMTVYIFLQLILEQHRPELHGSAYMQV